MYCIAFFCNLLGQFWIYLANKVRDQGNSAHEGDPNYCAPEIWYVINIVVYTFWIITVAASFIIGGKIFRFFRGPERPGSVVKLGNPLRRTPRPTPGKSGKLPGGKRKKHENEVLVV